MSRRLSLEAQKQVDVPWMWVVLSFVPIPAWVVVNESAIPDRLPLAVALILVPRIAETVWRAAQELVLSLLNEATGPVPVHVTLTVKAAGSPELLLFGQGVVDESIDACTDALCRPLPMVNALDGITKHPEMNCGNADSKMFRSVSA